jgi:hypothetical protein
MDVVRLAEKSFCKLRFFVWELTLFFTKPRKEFGFDKCWANICTSTFHNFDANYIIYTHNFV